MSEPAFQLTFLTDAEIFDEYCETTKRENLEREQKKNGSIFAKAPVLENKQVVGEKYKRDSELKESHKICFEHSLVAKESVAAAHCKGSATDSDLKIKLAQLVNDKRELKNLNVLTDLHIEIACLAEESALTQLNASPDNMYDWDFIEKYASPETKHHVDMRKKYGTKWNPLRALIVIKRSDRDVLLWFCKLYRKCLFQGFRRDATRSILSRYLDTIKKQYSDPIKNNLDQSPIAKKLGSFERELSWLTEESALFGNPLLGKEFDLTYMEEFASSQLKKALHKKARKLSDLGKYDIQEFMKSSVFRRFRKEVRLALFGGYKRKQLKIVLEKRNSSLSEQLSVNVQQNGHEILKTSIEETEGQKSIKRRKFEDNSKAGSDPDTNSFNAKKITIKNRHNVGDSVHACWVHDHQGRFWYPGKVRGYTINKTHPKYGECRLYHIDFDDGTIDRSLGEEFVMDSTDYNYSIDDDFKCRWESLGVVNVIDAKSDDNYAKYQGWYMAEKTGSKIFASLSDAINACDDVTVSQKGALVTKSMLILPENWELLPRKKTVPRRKKRD